MRHPGWNVTGFLLAGNSHVACERTRCRLSGSISTSDSHPAPASMPGCAAGLQRRVVEEGEDPLTRAGDELQEGDYVARNSVGQPALAEAVQENHDGERSSHDRGRRPQRQHRDH